LTPLTRWEIKTRKNRYRARKAGKKKKKGQKTDPRRTGSKNLEEIRARTTNPQSAGLGSH
jgi:hypothetical protein